MTTATPLSTHNIERVGNGNVKYNNEGLNARNSKHAICKRHIFKFQKRMLVYLPIKIYICCI